MIIIPMLGQSSRFFTAGYALPKYKLPLGGETVFSKSVKSFERLFASEPFLFLVRRDHNAINFVGETVSRLGIKDYRIIEFNAETRGQAESVLLGTSGYEGSIPIVIFNIDTIGHNFTWPEQESFGDGFIEVFESEGENWSFIEPGPDGRVLRTTEKERISNLCSNGMYGFARLLDFRNAYEEYKQQNRSVRGEIYIAPLYNLLIEKGMNIRYRTLKQGITEHCGIPGDYEFLKEKFGV